MKQERKLSERQKLVLDYIDFFITAYGYPPSQPDITKHFGWKSSRAVVGYLRILLRKGFLTRAPGVARSLRIAKEWRERPSDPILVLQEENASLRKKVACLELDNTNLRKTIDRLKGG